MTAELPELEYYDPELRGPRFHERLAELAREHWLARFPLGYVVLDREAGEFFLRSRSTTFPGKMVAEVFGVDQGPLREEIDRNILHIDGPQHARLRGLVNHAFTPKAADRWREVMRAAVAEQFARLSSPCDVVAELCKVYPARVIATVVGAPVEDAPRLAEWSNWIQRQFAPDFVEHRERIEQACAEMYEYLWALLATRREAPDDGLLSTLLAVDGLSDDEVVNLVLNVLVGGVDTTQSQLAQALRIGAEDPAWWAAAAADPAAAVEDVLRVEPVTPFTARICTADVEFRGVSFPVGTVVLIAAAAANREPGRLLTFGAGIHYCLGANLARAELQEGIGHLAPRMPGLRLADEPEYESVQGIYGLARLEVEWDDGVR